jgi:hypothetical protein
VGLIFDLAVAALALMVIGSLALLAWTLAVNAVRAAQVGRERVVGFRQSVTDAEGRLQSASKRATETLAELSHHATPGAGDRSDR